MDRDRSQVSAAMKGRPRSAPRSGGSILAIGVGALISVGCVTVFRGEPEPVAFSEVGKVILGQPVVNPDKGVVRIPILFEGASWSDDPERVVCFINSVSTQFTIELTALVGPPERELYTDQGAILLAGIPEGSYRVFYRDPDDTRHAIGRVQIPKASYPRELRPDAK